MLGHLCLLLVLLLLAWTPMGAALFAGRHLDAYAWTPMGLDAYAWTPMGLDAYAWTPMLGHLCLDTYGDDDDDDDCCC